MGNSINLSERIYVIWKPTFTRMVSKLYRDTYMKRIRKRSYDMWNDVFGFEGYPIIDDVEPYGDMAVRAVLHYNVKRKVDADAYTEFVEELLVKWYVNNKEYIDGFKIGIDVSSIQIYQ